MVNYDIVKYLEEGSQSGFGLELLKNKLLESGFSEQDMNEAVEEINRKRLNANVSSNIEISNGKYSGLVIMKVAAVVGIILALCSLINIILALIPSLSLSLMELISKNLNVCLFIFFILLIIFYLGFVYLGRNLGSRLLMISSFVIIIFMVCGLGLAFYGFLKASEGGNPYAGDLSGFVVSQFGENDLSRFGFEDYEGQVQDSSKRMIIFYIVAGILLIFFINYILFSAALIRINDVGFARVAGIFNLVLISAGVLLYSYLIYIFLTNLFSMLFLILHMISNPWIITTIRVGIGALGLLSLLFGSLTLFSGAKKFGTSG